MATTPTTTSTNPSTPVPFTAMIRRLVTKYNLGAHSVFVAWIFLETQWYSNPAFKQLILNLYAHTGLWFHALVPVAVGMIVNYRNSLATPAAGLNPPTPQEAP